VITDPAWHWNARDLVRDCGLSVFDFTHLRASQPHFAPYHRTVVASHAIDLSMGFDAYLRERREARGPDVTYGRPHHAAARLRALEKQMGPVRFELHDPDSEALRLLLGWKSQQYRKNGVPDAFSCSWCVALVERLHRHQSQHLAGMLSTLTAGGRIVAAHMGMRSPTVLHWWFPSYDPAFAKFSPGLILLTEVCRRAREDGVQLVELGAGDEPYKRQVANTSIPEASGFVGIPSAQTLLRRLCHGTEELAARLPLGPASHWPAKALRRIEKFRRYS
jgi:CelD/BcsL family acetyltransferase involved in cellulose biosynthesis